MASPELVLATTGLLVLYGAIILFFVIRGALRTTSMADYALGSIHFSPIVVGLSLAASITSAATFIINPGFIALYGFSGILAFAIVLPLGVFVSLTILTKSFRKHGASVKALTMAQWIGKRYGSQGYALLFGFLSLLLITFIVLICVGMTKVMASALNAEELYVLIGLVIFVFGYMMFGGANSMVYTNTIQAILMLIVAFILLTSGYEHFSEGVKGFIDKLAAIDPLLVAPVNPQSFLFRDYFEIVFCNLVVGVAIVCQPHIITKSLLLKEESDVNRYLVTAIIVEAIFFAVVLTGLYARLTFPDLTINGEAMKMDNIIPAYVVTEFPVFIGLIVILGLLSAGLSTLEGLIQSLSTTVTSDIIEPLAGQRLGEGLPRARRLIAINKLVIIALASVAIFLSYDQLVNPSLSVGIFAQNGVYAYFSAAFVPVLLGIYFREVPRAAPIAASITAVAVHFATYYGGISWYMQAEVRNPAIAATFAILASLAVGLTLNFVLRKRRQASPAVAVEARPAGVETPAAAPRQPLIPYAHHRLVLADGIEIGYAEMGAGPQTLLFLHGLGSNYKGWLKLMEELAGPYRCIALDFPGYATSSKGEYPMSMAFLAAKVIAASEQLGLERPILVGHSMGGQVAMTAVLQRPELFEKLILVSPAGLETFNKVARQILLKLSSPKVLQAVPLPQVKRNFEANFVEFSADAQFMLEDRLELMRQTEAFAYYCQLISRCVKAMLDEPVQPRLPEIKLPALIFFGSNDQLIPNRMLNPTLDTRVVGEIGLRAIAGSRLVMLPNCGHFAQWERAESMAEEIRGFLG
jgi:sodium/pantothenate symporter